MQNFEKLDEGKHQATVVGAQWLWRSQDLGKRGTQGGGGGAAYSIYSNNTEGIIIWFRNRNRNTAQGEVHGENVL